MGRKLVKVGSGVWRDGLLHPCAEEEERVGRKRRGLGLSATATRCGGRRGGNRAGGKRVGGGADVRPSSREEEERASNVGGGAKVHPSSGKRQ